MRSGVRKLPGLTSNMAGVILEIVEVKKLAGQYVWFVKFKSLVTPFEIKNKPNEGLNNLTDVSDDLITREPVNWLDEAQDEANYTKVANWLRTYAQENNLGDEVPDEDLPKEIYDLARSYDRFWQNFVKFIHKPTPEQESFSESAFGVYQGN